ncbi:hypothetical protein [Streptomyces sp. H39-S7]|uniref:hypothetical protein n=1 Tax=Streptomyces sp. H39-S7 TaxID=3004357 RepID=UPI002F359DF9
MSAGMWVESLVRQYPALIEELVPSAQRRTGPRGSAPSGGGTAPMRIHISDTIRDIADGVTELEEAVRERLGLRAARPVSVPDRLRRIAGLLDRIDQDPDLSAHVLDEARRMARRCARALGDPEQIVRIPGRCPFCDSVSLRAFPERGTVLCANPACRCPDDACPCGDTPAFRHGWNATDLPVEAAR